MKVIDAIASALLLLGRPELVPYIEDPSNSTYEDADDVVETLLYCFNAVEDELARKYIPLVASEEMSSGNNQFLFSGFKRCPLKINRVTADDKTVPFEVYAEYLSVHADKIVVKYEYAPSKKRLADISDYGDEVGIYLIALGMASEYCVINGEAEMAEIWEKRYRAYLDKVQRTLPVCAHIPPRRWI